jgi:hypothetical protein
MDLQDSWNLTINLLNKAKSIVLEENIYENETLLKQYDEFIEHNELELVANMIEEVKIYNSERKYQIYTILVKVYRNMNINDGIVRINKIVY